MDLIGLRLCKIKRVIKRAIKRAIKRVIMSVIKLFSFKCVSE